MKKSKKSKKSHVPKVPPSESPSPEIKAEAVVEKPAKATRDFQTRLHEDLAKTLEKFPTSRRKFSTDEARQTYINGHR